MRDKLIPKIPLVLVSIFGLISLFITVRAVCNYLFLMTGFFTGRVTSFILFGDSDVTGRIDFWLSSLFLIIGWLISTKFKALQGRKWRYIWFGNMLVGLVFQFMWLATVPVMNTLIPYVIEIIGNLSINNLWLSIAIGDPQTLLVTLLFTPTVVFVITIAWLFGQYSQYSQELKEAFWEFEIKNAHLQKLFRLDKTEKWPDVVLGPDSKTKELVIQPGRDRTLNNVIVGSIGSGKTSALVLPILNSDLHWMSRFINDFPKIFKREDYHSEEVEGMYLNGVSIIEPSNDLCQKAYQLVCAHGIPEEAVFYIDPTNPNTPNINPMEGPVDKVAEAFAMVMEGLAEGGQSNFFFQQSERNHLKHYIYLLKLHDPEQEVTFDMLLRMYDEPNLVREMHVKLKKTIPTDIDSIENRDERNHWAIVKQIDSWFDQNHLPLTERGKDGSVPKQVKEGEYRGQPAYYDGKSEYVQGLRNILNDIGASPLIRRVLFGKSKFSFDEHLNRGGVLLLNTAKGELGGLSNVLGKLVLLCLQNAVFRRKPNSSSFHHIMVDEFPDYVYQPFKEFPAQSRKYKVIVTVVCQTVTQLADKYGETYMHTLLAALRHKMVYGDIPDYDAQLFSKIFGEEERFEESVQEQVVSPLQEQPMLRTGNTFQKSKEAILSPSDIIYQKAFQCAVKIVSENKPMKVTQIDANFVPKEEFKKAVVIVEEEAAQVWLANRKNNKGITAGTPLLEQFEILDEKDVLSQPLSEEKDAIEIPAYVGRKQPSNPDINYEIIPNKKKGEEKTLENNSEEMKIPPQFTEENVSESKVETTYRVELPKEEVEKAEVIEVVEQLDREKVTDEIDNNENDILTPTLSELNEEQLKLKEEVLTALEEVESPEAKDEVTKEEPVVPAPKAEISSIKFIE